MDSTEDSREQCDICGSIHKNHMAMIKHRRRAHFAKASAPKRTKVEEEMCDICGLMLKNHKSLMRHRRKVHHVYVKSPPDASSRNMDSIVANQNNSINTASLENVKHLSVTAIYKSTNQTERRVSLSPPKVDAQQKYFNAIKKCKPSFDLNRNLGEVKPSSASSQARTDVKGNQDSDNSLVEVVIVEDAPRKLLPHQPLPLQYHRRPLEAFGALHMFPDLDAISVNDDLCSEAGDAFSVFHRPGLSGIPSVLQTDSVKQSNTMKLMKNKTGMFKPNFQPPSARVNVQKTNDVNRIWSKERQEERSVNKAEDASQSKKMVSVRKKTKTSKEITTGKEKRKKKKSLLDSIDNASVYSFSLDHSNDDEQLDDDLTASYEATIDAVINNVISDRSETSFLKEDYTSCEIGDISTSSSPEKKPCSIPSQSTVKTKKGQLKSFPKIRKLKTPSSLKRVNELKKRRAKLEKAAKSLMKSGSKITLTEKSQKTNVDAPGLEDAKNMVIKEDSVLESNEEATSEMDVKSKRSSVKEKASSAACQEVHNDTTESSLLSTVNISASGTLQAEEQEVESSDSVPENVHRSRTRNSAESLQSETLQNSFVNSHMPTCTDDLDTLKEDWSMKSEVKHKTGLKKGAKRDKSKTKKIHEIQENSSDLISASENGMKVHENLLNGTDCSQNSANQIGSVSQMMDVSVTENVNASHMKTHTCPFPEDDALEISLRMNFGGILCKISEDLIVDRKLQSKAVVQLKQMDFCSSTSKDTVKEISIDSVQDGSVKTSEVDEVDGTELVMSTGTLNYSSGLDISVSSVEKMDASNTRTEDTTSVSMETEEFCPRISSTPCSDSSSNRNEVSLRENIGMTTELQQEVQVDGKDPGHKEDQKEELNHEVTIINESHSGYYEHAIPGMSKTQTVLVEQGVENVEPEIATEKTELVFSSQTFQKLDSPLQILRMFIPVVKEIKGLDFKKIMKIPSEKQQVMEVLDFRSEASKSTALKDTTISIEDHSNCGDQSESNFIQENIKGSDSDGHDTAEVLHSNSQGNELQNYNGRAGDLATITNYIAPDISEEITITTDNAVSVADQGDDDKSENVDMFVTHLCAQCSQEYESQEKLEQHRCSSKSPVKRSPRKPKLTSKKKEFHCKFCDLKYYRHSSLQSHLLSSHPAEELDHNSKVSERFPSSSEGTNGVVDAYNDSVNQSTSTAAESKVSQNLNKSLSALPSSEQSQDTTESDAKDVTTESGVLSDASQNETVDSLTPVSEEFTKDFILTKLKDIQPALQLYACHQIMSGLVSVKDVQMAAENLDDLQLKRISENIWIVKNSSGMSKCENLDSSNVSDASSDESLEKCPYETDEKMCNELGGYSTRKKVKVSLNPNNSVNNVLEGEETGFSTDNDDVHEPFHLETKRPKKTKLLDDFYVSATRKRMRKMKSFRKKIKGTESDSKSGMTDFEKAITVNEEVKKKHKKSTKKALGRQSSSETNSSDKRDAEGCKSRKYSEEELKMHAEETKAAPQSRIVMKILRDKALEKKQREEEFQPIITELPTFSEILQNATTKTVASVTEASAVSGRQVRQGNQTTQDEMNRENHNMRRNVGDQLIDQVDFVTDAFDDIATGTDIDVNFDDVNMLCGAELFKDDAQVVKEALSAAQSLSDNRLTDELSNTNRSDEFLSQEQSTGYDASNFLDQIYGPKKSFTRSFRKTEKTVEREKFEFRSPLISNENQTVTQKISRNTAPFPISKPKPDFDKLRRMLENTMAQSVLSGTVFGNSHSGSLLQKKAELGLSEQDDSLTTESVFGTDLSKSDAAPKFSFLTRPNVEMKDDSKNTTKDPEKKQTFEDSGNIVDDQTVSIPTEEIPDSSSVKRVPPSIVKKSIPDSTTIDFSSSPLKVQVFTEENNQSSERLVTVEETIQGNDFDQESGAVSSSGFSVASIASGSSTCSQENMEEVDESSQTIEKELSTTVVATETDNPINSDNSSKDSTSSNAENSNKEEEVYNEEEPKESQEEQSPNVNKNDKGSDEETESSSSEDSSSDTSDDDEDSESDDNEEQSNKSDDSSDDNDERAGSPVVKETKETQHENVEELQLFADSDDSFLGDEDEEFSSYKEKAVDTAQKSRLGSDKEESKDANNGSHDNRNEEDMDVEDGTSQVNQEVECNRNTVNNPVNQTPGNIGDFNNFPAAASVANTTSTDGQATSYFLEVIQNQDWQRRICQLLIIPKGYCFHFIKGPACTNVNCSYTHRLPSKEEVFFQGLRRIAELACPPRSSHMRGRFPDKEKAFEVYRFLCVFEMIFPPDTLQLLLNLAFSHCDADCAFELLNHLCHARIINEEIACHLISICSFYPKRYKEGLWKLFEYCSSIGIHLLPQQINTLLRVFLAKGEMVRVWKLLTHYNYISNSEIPLTLIAAAFQSLIKDQTDLPLALSWLSSCDPCLLQKLDSLLLQRVLKILVKKKYLEHANMVQTANAEKTASVLGMIGPDDNCEEDVGYYDNEVSSSEDVKSIINRLKGSFVSRNYTYMAEIFIDISSTQDCSNQCYIKALVDGFNSFHRLGKDPFFTAVEEFFKHVNIAYEDAKKEDVLTRKDLRILGSLGNQLLRSCYNWRWCDVGYRLITLLRLHHIHYYKYNPHEAASPHIDVITTEICLKLDLASEALQILEGNGWHCLKTKNQEPDVYMCTLEILKVLMSQLLKKKSPAEVSRILLQLLQLKSDEHSENSFSNINFGLFFEHVIKCSLGISDLLSALGAYNIYENCIGDQALSVSLCRGLLTAWGSWHKAEGALSLFNKLMSLDFYPPQSINNSPRIILVWTSLTLVEVKLLIDDYLDWFYHHLCDKLQKKRTKYLLEEDLSLGIKVVYKDLDPSQVPYCCSVPQNVLAMKNALLTLLEEEFKPSLIVANRFVGPKNPQQDIICRIFPPSLLAYLQDFDKKNRKQGLLFSTEASNQKTSLNRRNSGPQHGY